jgi:hypothetical protein
LNSGIWWWQFQRRFNLLGKKLQAYQQLCWSLMIHQLTDWLAHVPKEVLAKNFQVSISSFDHIPSRELYIFPAREFLCASTSVWRGKLMLCNSDPTASGSCCRSSTAEESSRNHPWPIRLSVFSI